MALDRKNLLTLMKTVAKANPSAPTAYSFNGESLSYEALNETLRREMNEIAGCGGTDFPYWFTYDA